MFESAARHLNFRIAADELGLTHSAVAQQIRALEQALDVKLFRRLSRSLALTDAGRIYLASVQRALRMIATATEELRPQKAVLTVSVTTSFAAKWLIPRLGQFTDVNPDVEVQVLATSSLANFQDDGVDLAVRQAKPPFGPGLRVDLLFPSRLSPVCSPSIISSRRPLSTLEELSNYVLLHDGHGLWPIFLAKAGSAKEASAFKALKFSHESLAIDAAISGQGVALASEPLVEDDIRLGRLCRPLKFALNDELGYYVVAPRAPRKAEGVRRMREWLLAHGPDH
jgi:LysR family transcriptional regulator, glycine cleavage system transcriptional activator